MLLYKAYVKIPAQYNIVGILFVGHQVSRQLIEVQRYAWLTGKLVEVQRYTCTWLTGQLVELHRYTSLTGQFVEV